MTDITGAKLRTASSGWVTELSADGRYTVHLAGDGHTNPDRDCPVCHAPPTWRERLALWAFETIRGRR